MVTVRIPDSALPTIIEAARDTMPIQKAVDKILKYFLCQVKSLTINFLFRIGQISCKRKTWDFYFSD